MAHSNILPSFTSGVQYLSRQQCFGQNNVGTQLINRRFEHGSNLYSKDLYAHYGCVNAIEFSNDGEWLVSGGDDKRILVWNIDKTLSGAYIPKAMKAEHNSNIFCLSFSISHTKLYSAGNDEQVILHDVTTGETLDVFLHDEAIYGLSVDPLNENIFASACDDGRVSIWDIRDSSSDAFVLCESPDSFHSVMYNPSEPRLLATANAKEGIGLWDVRKPRTCLIKYGESLINQGAMSLRFNSMGTNILALRRRLPPVLYEVSSANAVAEFDHQEYYNSCTMKSCCFAGNSDQYVLSGSDDFKLYIWKVPDHLSTSKKTYVNDTHRVIRGHRSIVNQVRYNSVYGMIASSGVEKVIKLWSTFPMSQNDCINNYVSKSDSLRKVYTHAEYISLVLENGQFMTHDYSHQSVQEDPRMMAFFDSLVQRDIEGWTSDSSGTSTITAAHSAPCFEVQSAESSSITSSLSSSSSSDDEENHLRKWVSPTTGFVLPDGRLTPHVMMCLNSLRRRGMNVQDYPNKGPANEDNRNSADRISQLIAQKRKDHMLKISKKKLKQQKKSVSKTNGSIPVTTEILQQDALAMSQGKDNRKLLRKKRAKLERNFDLSDESDSDSNTRNKDGNNETLSETVHNINDTENHIKLDKAVENIDTMSPVEFVDEIRDNKINANVNETVQTSEDIKFDEVVQNKSVNYVNLHEAVKDISQKETVQNTEVQPNCIEQECNLVMNNGTSPADNSCTTKGCSMPLDAECSTNSLNKVEKESSHANSVIFFQSKNGKRKRNYRKRSAEDMHDD